MVAENELEKYAEEILRKQFSKDKDVVKTVIIPTLIGLGFGGLLCTISERCQMKRRIRDLEDRVRELEEK